MSMYVHVQACGKTHETDKNTKSETIINNQKVSKINNA